MIKLNLDKNKKYLLACSFGPDSMALFHLLQKNKYDFSCAIVNYHLRKESDTEVAGLLDYASKFGVKVYVYDVKEKISKNIEATCREIRYKFFKELCGNYGFDACLVAHHQDDLIETYLMQKQRQNNPIFYGISQNTLIYGVNIVRPLLDYKKTDLVKFCDENHVPYSIDQTNSDISILRNKIRHNVVNKLSEKERVNILKEIKEENAKLSKMFDLIDISRLCEVDYVLSLANKAQSYALNYLAKNINQSLSLSNENVGQVINILKSNKPNGQFAVFRGLYLFKEYDFFEFGICKVKPIDYEYHLDCPGVLDTPYFYLDFTKGASDRNVTDDDYPLTIRNIKKTDYLIINGYKSYGNRLLIDWKVPFRKRMIWPVIVNKNNKVIYIPRYRKDFVVSNKLNFFVK